MPKVSVLIATYNREDFLEKCLESLRNQTFKDFEIVLVDDGSTDGTSKFKDQVDIYHYQDHGGISKARNKALELMNGEYFFVLDSDDTITPDCLEKHVREIGDHDFVFPYYIYTADGTKPTVVHYHPQNLEDCYHIKKIPHCGLYRKETLGHFRYDISLSSAVDYDYILNILKTFPEIKMKAIPEPLYIYRHHSKQERDTPGQIISIGIIRNKYRI